MRISLIVARAENGVIGKDNAIPWRISADMKYFKKITMGKPIVMGRKTFQSLGKPLPGRLNIILTQDGGFRAQGAEVFHRFEEAQALANSQGAEELIVIGGAQIYALALSQVDRIYLTEVHGSVEGDTILPPFDSTTWREVSRDFLAKDEKASHDCSFVILERAQQQREALSESPH